MNDILNRAFTLTLELEGLIQLAVSRAELLPTEAETLMTQKAREINELVCAYCAHQSEEVKQSEETKQSEDAIAEIVSIADPQPVQIEEERDDLSRLLSLNDRYLFRRELFHNSKEEMSEGISVINSMNSYEEAADYLINDLCIDETTSAGEQFLGIVERFFSHH